MHSSWSPPKKRYPISKDKGETVGKAPETLGCHKQILCATRTQGKRSSVPHKDWTRLACECFRVFCRGLGQQWLAAGTGALAAVVLGDAECWHKYLDCRGFDWAASGPTTNKEGTQAHPLAENWIKDLLSRPCPSKQDSVFPTACPSHQEACTSLLSSSIRGQTIFFFGLVLRHIPGLDVCFLSQVREVFSYFMFKHVLCPFLFLLLLVTL